LENLNKKGEEVDPAQKIRGGRKRKRGPFLAKKSCTSAEEESSQEKREAPSPEGSPVEGGKRGGALFTSPKRRENLRGALGGVKEKEMGRQTKKELSVQKVEGPRLLKKGNSVSVREKRSA